MKVEPARNVLQSGPAQADFKPSTVREHQSERQIPTVSIALLTGVVIASLLLQWPVHFPGELRGQMQQVKAPDQQFACQTDHNHNNVTSTIDPYSPPEWAISSAKDLTKRRGKHVLN